MSVDLFLYTEKELSKDCKILLDYGFVQLEEGYFFEDKKSSINIDCFSLEDADYPEEILDKILERLPNVKYQIEINFSGEFLESDLLIDAEDWTLNLIKELNGVLDDDSALTYANGEKQYYDIIDDEFVFSSTPFNEDDTEEKISVEYSAAKRKAKLYKRIQIITISLAAIFLALFLTFIFLDYIAIGGIFFALALTPAIIMCVCEFKVKKYNTKVEQLKLQNILDNGEQGIEPVLEAMADNADNNDFAADDDDDNYDLEEDLDERREIVEQYDFSKNTTHLNFEDNASNKFWSCGFEGEYYFVHYGKNGTFGSLVVKQGASSDLTEKFVKRTIVEKMRKGYKIKQFEEDALEQHKKEALSIIESMHFMFGDDVPLIHISSIKAACEKYCDLLRYSAGNKEKILSAVKLLVLYLNNYGGLEDEDLVLIETDEREQLCDFIDKGAELAGFKHTGEWEDITEEWREW